MGSLWIGDDSDIDLEANVWLKKIQKSYQKKMVKKKKMVKNKQRKKLVNKE